MSLGAIITGLGRALVSWGLGGGPEAETQSGPGAITLPRVAALCKITLPRASALCTITLPKVIMANRLNIGDIARIGTADAPIIIRDEDGDVADPETLMVRIKTPLGQRVELTYGETAEVDGDEVIRFAEGHYGLRIAITGDRGVGPYGYTVVTTGVVAAEGDTFTVSELPA